MDDALALLRLQLDWGADEAINTDPVDRLRPAAPKTAPPPAAIPERPKGTPDERALAAAAQAATLEQLQAVVANFDGCALRDTASHTVFAEGHPASTTLIIGEPPGRDEDRSGHPFSGPEGLLLDQMLASIGLTRTELMLMPLLPWRPPGGRPPSPIEILVCQPFLHRLIVLLKPRRLVLFGGSAARVILPRPQNRRRAPRSWIDATIPGSPEPHPTLALPALTELLSNPPARRDVWTALRLLRRSIDGSST